MNKLAEYPKSLVDEVVFLPEVPQAELNANGLFVVRGLTVALAEQLVERSKEAPVVKMCKNDAETRFISVEAVAEWQEKGRLALPLVREAAHDALQLMGLTWMGPGVPNEKKGEPHIEGAAVTYAQRLYAGATGQGNAPYQTRAILDAHDLEFGNEGVWLEAWGDNTRALQAYEANGFVEVARLDGNRHGETVDRVYMTLGDLSAQEA